MKLLLDTHVWLWFHLGDPQLSAVARQQIEDPANENFLSPASFWEISLKIKLGKYILNTSYARFMQDSIAGNGFKILNIAPPHTEIVSTLPFAVIAQHEHRDPFDRLLIAQAKVEGMTIVTNDAKFGAYGIPIVW
jgi:PIN domain nuclease of toxin-antitoxin system